MNRNFFRLMIVFIAIVTATIFIDGQAFAAVKTQTNEPTANDRIIVGYAGEVRSASIDSLHAAVGATQVGAISQIGVDLVRVAPDQVDAALALYRANPAVAYAEIDSIATGQLVPNDPNFSTYQYGLSITKINQAWDLTTGSSDIVVAVVDTGADFSHPDLQGKLIAGYDFVNGDADPSDDYGHGTHVAGIVAATANNGIGVAGAGYNTRVLVVKVLNASNSGSYSTIAQGIIFAADQGADVINLSLGGTASGSALQSAVDYAHNKGSLVVAAAGNSNTNVAFYPAAYTNAMGVAASDYNDARWSYSNYGSYVSVAAPGASIYSTEWAGTADYAFRSGTSMAAPHVSAIAALMRATNSSLTPDQLRSMIETSADDLGAAGWDDYFGHGRVNALAAVQAAQAAQPEPTPINTPEPTPTNTPEPTPTNTPEPTPTNTPEPTPTNTPEPTPTNTPEPTPTNTPEPVQSNQVVYVSSTTGGNVDGISFADEDIMGFDPTSGAWSMIFDGSDVGIGTSDVDAFSLLPDGSVLLSTNAAYTFPGIGAVADADIVRFVPTSLGTTTAGAFEWYFDGSDVELTTNGEDVDSVAILSDGRILVSTVGGYAAGGLRGGDEDVLVFTPSSLGENTSGTWALYFDGSDVALTDSYEDVYGLAVDESTGDLYLTTQAAFAVDGLSGATSDVFSCTATSLGSNTACGFAMVWQGGNHGFGAETIDALDVSSASLSVMGFDFRGEMEHDPMNDVDDVDPGDDVDDSLNIYLPLVVGR